MGVRFGVSLVRPRPGLRGGGRRFVHPDGDDKDGGGQDERRNLVHDSFLIVVLAPRLELAASTLPW